MRLHWTARGQFCLDFWPIGPPPAMCNVKLHGRMIFIETRPNDDRVALAKNVREAYEAVYGELLPFLSFGRVIAWQGRTFMQLGLSSGDSILEFEDGIFQAWKLPVGRARVLLGSMKGEVFTSPPQEGEQPAARIKEGGRCGREYLVKPFSYVCCDSQA